MNLVEVGVTRPVINASGAERLTKKQAQKLRRQLQQIVAAEPEPDGWWAVRFVDLTDELRAKPDPKAAAERLVQKVVHDVLNADQRKLAWRAWAPRPELVACCHNGRCAEVEPTVPSGGVTRLGRMVGLDTEAEDPEITRLRKARCYKEAQRAAKKRRKALLEVYARLATDWRIRAAWAVLNEPEPEPELSPEECYPFTDSRIRWLFRQEKARGEQQTDRRRVPTAPNLDARDDPQGVDSYGAVGGGLEATADYAVTELYDERQPGAQCAPARRLMRGGDPVDSETADDADTLAKRGLPKWSNDTPGAPRPRPMRPKRRAVKTTGEADSDYGQSLDYAPAGWGGGRLQKGVPTWSSDVVWDDSKSADRKWAHEVPDHWMHDKDRPSDLWVIELLRWTGEAVEVPFVRTADAHWAASEAEAHREGWINARENPKRKCPYQNGRKRVAWQKGQELARCVASHSSAG